MDTLIELIANICVNIFALDTEEYVRGVSNLVNNMFDQVPKMIMYYSDPRMSDIAGDAVFWPAQVERIIEVIEKGDDMMTLDVLYNETMPKLLELRAELVKRGMA